IWICCRPYASFQEVSPYDRQESSHQYLCFAELDYTIRFSHLQKDILAFWRNTGNHTRDKAIESREVRGSSMWQSVWLYKTPCSIGSLPPLCFCITHGSLIFFGENRIYSPLWGERGRFITGNPPPKEELRPA